MYVACADDLMVLIALSRRSWRWHWQWV